MLPGISARDAGADVVRIAVDSTAEAEAVAEIRRQTAANLVVDLQENYRLAERSYGLFYRVIELPHSIDPSKVQATMSNGVLKVKIPKPAHSEAKKIEVKEAA